MSEIRVVIPDELDDYMESQVRTGVYPNKAEMTRMALNDYIKNVSSIASEYDKENIFSPEGRVYQMEYAREAGYRANNLIGMETKDSVILAHEVNKPELGYEMEKVIETDNGLLIGGSGLFLDMVKITSEFENFEVKNYKNLRYAVSEIYHEYTVKKDVRPLGTTLLLGCKFDGKPHLYEIDASGAMRRWKATATGKDRDKLKEKLSELYQEDLSDEDAEKICKETFSEKEIKIKKL